MYYPAIPNTILNISHFTKHSKEPLYNAGPDCVSVQHLHPITKLLSQLRPCGVMQLCTQCQSVLFVH